MMEGLYGRFGEWAYRVGLLGGSGVGGGICGRPWCDGNCRVSPPLDEEGNSVRGQKMGASVAKQLAVTCLRADHDEHGR
ncbi:glutaminase [Escherichia coli]